MANDHITSSRNTPVSVVTGRSPIAEATALARDRRRSIIRELQERTGRTLLCYVSERAAAIDEEDVRYLQEILGGLQHGTSIDLLLHSDGGYPSTSEKMIRMLWDIVDSKNASKPSGKLHVIVPDRAKSAATLLALGANKIIMSSTSELGPIDPQVPKFDEYGNCEWISVFDYLDAYDRAVNGLRTSPEDPVARAVFERFDPVDQHRYNQERDYVRMTAEDFLKRQPNVNYTYASGQLMNPARFPSHSQVIDWEMAQKDIGLNVEFMDSEHALWQMYWKLYCYLRRAIEPGQKIFESDLVSLVVQKTCDT